MNVIKRLGTLFIACALLGTLANAAPKAEHANKYITIEGKVLQINQKARTMLVADVWSPKLYLVTVPKGQKFRITFGLNMRNTESEFEDARRNDRVRLRAIRDQEHLARLDDGRQVVLLTASR